jgi:hypothetical protein
MKLTSTRKALLSLAVILVVSLATEAALIAFSHRTSNDSSTITRKLVILYINQGNGSVNRTNFETLTAFASGRGFNTLFFQVCRSGRLLFSIEDLATFVREAHAANLSIFLAIAFNATSLRIPVAIYGAGEDGISLDFSNLDLQHQDALFASLKANYGGTTAVTTYAVNPLAEPDVTVLETYTSASKALITPGIVGSVEVAATGSRSDYQAQFSYALDHSDGVMVFDYAGLLKRGY